MTWRQRLLAAVVVPLVVAAYVVDTIARRAWDPDQEIDLENRQCDPEWQER